MWPGYRLRTGPLPKGMSSSPRTASTRSFGTEVTPPSHPVFSGSVAYRGVIPHDRIPSWPTDSWLMWLGKGKHFLTFPLRAGQLINYVGFVPADEEMKEFLVHAGRSRRSSPRVRWLGPADRVHCLSQVSVTFRWALYDREPLPTWSRGRLTLLGDAAHPMLPHLGQGANQSIEDGMALATILARANLKTCDGSAGLRRAPP